MTKSAPVTLLARLLARKSTTSATSPGWVKRRATIWLAACRATSCPLALAASLTVCATPSAPSRRSVVTGSGLTALESTFGTSVAGVVTFTILSMHQHGPVAPDWPTGIALGAGGLASAYASARIQPRLPETFIRRLAGTLGRNRHPLPPGRPRLTPAA